MKAILSFELPENDYELRAAIDAVDHISSIRDFYERLKVLDKHGHNYKSTEEAISCLYSDYYDIMKSYLEMED